MLNKKKSKREALTFFGRCRSEQQQENDNKIIQTRFVVTAAGIVSCGARWILMGFFYFIFSLERSALLKFFPLAHPSRLGWAMATLERLNLSVSFFPFSSCVFFFVSLSPTPLPSCQWVDPHT